MKRINLLLTFIVSILVLIMPIKAANTISLVCNQTTTNTTTCKIKLNIDEIDDISPIDIYFSTNDLDVNINAVGNLSTNCGFSKCSVTSIQSGENIVATLNITNPTDKDVKPTIQIDSTYGKDSKTFTLKALKKSTTTTTTKSKSDNNYLSSIMVNDKRVDDFSKTKSKYFVEVENDIKKVNIQAKAEDDASKIKVEGPKSLVIGDNEYTISVTSENDTTRFYKVIVTRKDEDASSNTDIKKIKIKGYKLNFDKNSKTFYLNIDKEDTELDIDVVLADKKADYDISGNESLKDGSIIKILVTAEDGTTDTYRIIIQKKSNSILPIIIFSIIVLIIIVSTIFIIVNKNKKNKKTKSKKHNKDAEDEKTKEMPVINAKNEINDEYQYYEEQITPIDNDEQEPTRILSYVEQKELEKTKTLDSKDINSIIDDELNKKTYENNDYDD